MLLGPIYLRRLVLDNAMLYEDTIVLQHPVRTTPAAVLFELDVLARRLGAAHFRYTAGLLVAVCLRTEEDCGGV